MPLPADGPTTLTLVKAQLQVTSTTDDAYMSSVVDATNDVVRGFPIADESDTDPAPATWPDRIVRGATMLAARLVRRRNSPAGVEAFTDAGAVYVQRNDPDVAMLLKLGHYAKPQVG